jgi:ubiquinone/menaquinone biosynthesis C-methylase UbiE
MNKFPSGFDLERMLTAYAYWVCTAVHNHGKDWAITMQEYVDIAIRDALLESQAEQIELELFRQELSRAAAPLLDVGAGWGRFGVLYAQFGLEAVYVEPSNLGCLLLRHNGLTNTVRCLGQLLSFPVQTFRSVVIGWVLHHESADIPSASILSEIARVTNPGGRLISIEPLRADFDVYKWRGLVEATGFRVQKIETFFETLPGGAKSEQYAYLIADRRAEE